MQKKCSELSLREMWRHWGVLCFYLFFAPSFYSDAGFAASVPTGTFSGRGKGPAPAPSSQAEEIFPSHKCVCCEKDLVAAWVLILLVFPPASFSYAIFCNVATHCYFGIHPPRLLLPLNFFLLLLVLCVFFLFLLLLLFVSALLLKTNRWQSSATLRVISENGKQAWRLFRKSGFFVRDFQKLHFFLARRANNT